MAKLKLLVCCGNGAGTSMIWEVRQYSRAPIISDNGDSGGKKVYRMGCRPGISTSFGQLDQHVPVCIAQAF